MNAALAENTVATFIKTFGASTDIRLWWKLIKEETLELKAEIGHGNKVAALKELADTFYVVAGASIFAEQADLLPREEAYEFMTALEAAQAVCIEAIEKFEFTQEQLTMSFQRVHESNMSKLGEDGKPKKRKDGKILKGPNYKAPDLSDLVE